MDIIVNKLEKSDYDLIRNLVFVLKEFVYSITFYQRHLMIHTLLIL